MTLRRTIYRLAIRPLVAHCRWPPIAWLKAKTNPQNRRHLHFPVDEMKSFKIAAGYRIELVAAEPLVHDPVAMTFDPDGRIWVCEMRGFMPDVDGKRENEPVGTITVLEDTDGDGVMDKSTVFLDKLVLPRAVCWTTDGLLVAENGKIWLCRAKNGGLTCDEKKLLFEYNPGNPEHSLNGLMPALDNWIYNAKEGFRIRKVGDKWIREATVPAANGAHTDDQATSFTTLTRHSSAATSFPATRRTLMPPIH